MNETEQGYINVGKLADFAPDQVRAFKVAEDEEVCIVNLDGELHAFSNYCTHIRHRLHVNSAGSITWEGKIGCWVHESTYDMKTGAWIWGPGIDPLPVYQLRIEGDDVWLAIEPQPPV